MKNRLQHIDELHKLPCKRADELQWTDVFIPRKKSRDGHSYSECLDWLTQFDSEIRNKIRKTDYKIVLLTGYSDNPDEIWLTNIDHYHAKCYLVWKAEQ